MLGVCVVGWWGDFLSRCRLQLHIDQQRVFNILKPFVERVLQQEWRQVARTSCPVSWCASRVQKLSLLMDSTHLGHLLACGENWRSEGSTHLLALLGSESHLAQLLFKDCVSDVMEN